MSLELEIRPLAAAGLIFHLGQAQATPYVQLQVSTEQVSRAVVLRDFLLHHCALGRQNLTSFHPRSCCGPVMGQESSPRGCPTPSFVMDSGTEWQVRGPFPLLQSREGCGSDHRLAGLGDTNLLYSDPEQERAPPGGRHAQQPHHRPSASDPG